MAPGELGDPVRGQCVFEFAGLALPQEFSVRIVVRIHLRKYVRPSVRVDVEIYVQNTCQNILAKSSVRIYVSICSQRAKE